MTLSSLVDTGYPVFGIDDPAAESLRRLVEAGLTAAPVVKQGRYVGIVSAASLLGGRKGFPASSVSLRSSGLAQLPAFGSDLRILENLKAVMALESEIIPIVDTEGQFEGVVPKRSILDLLASHFHVDDGGATIEIQVPPSGTRLSEFVASIEKNDAQVLSFSSTPFDPAGGTRTLFFRVQTNDLFRLVRNLENYGYIIEEHSPFVDGGYDEMRERAMEFIRYMDM